MNRTGLHFWSARAAAPLVLAAVASELFSAAFAAPPLYRPGREHRTISTDMYQISIQQNGRVDVTLGAGVPVFSGMGPMVRYADEESAEPMTVDGKWSTRTPVNDALGEGQGIALKKDECTWSVRAYPTKPFFAVQVEFENRTKKPVSIAELIPWSTQRPRKSWFSLGPGSVEASRRDRAIGLLPSVDTAGTGRDNVTLFNSTNGRSLIAGFLTGGDREHGFRIEPDLRHDRDTYGTFQASTVFDPPRVLAPGERLVSDVLYLSVSEPNPLEGLERYIRAVAAANDILSDGSDAFFGWLPETLGDFHLFDGQSARPIDLFGERRPKVWAVAPGGSAGKSHLAVLINWKRGRPEQIAVPFVSLGMDPRAYYTVYDPSTEEYFGTATGLIKVEVGPGGARTLAFQRFAARPMLLSGGSRESDLSSLRSTAAWDAQHRTLSGAVESPNGEYSLNILVPGSYSAKGMKTSGRVLHTEMEGGVLKIVAASEASSTLTWRIDF